MTTDDLFDAVAIALPEVPHEDAICHRGICPQNECTHCQRLSEAHAALRMLKKIVADPDLTGQLRRLRSLVNKTP